MFPGSPWWPAVEMMLMMRAFDAALDHRLGDVLGEQECAGQDDADLLLPFGERHVEHALLVEECRVVHQDVDPAERLASAASTAAVTWSSSQTSQVMPIARPPVDLMYLAQSAALSGTGIDADDRRALGRQALGDAAADVGAGARHDRNLVA